MNYELENERDALQKQEKMTIALKSISKITSKYYQKILKYKL